MVKVADLPSFDMAESLKTEEDIVMYLNMVLEENDPAELAHALGVIAKARGMTQIAKEAGIGREALYKALRHDSAPRFDTINRVVNALGLKITVQHAKKKKKYNKNGNLKLPFLTSHNVYYVNFRNSLKLIGCFFT